MEKISPMMEQYFQIKEQYKDCLIFYRLGDFYELFYDDAIVASQALDLTLTGRPCGGNKRAPMCGVPYHSAENYLAKLVSMGHKVAICEQLTEPGKGVKMVERDVVRVVTPGTVIEDSMLEEGKNNYLMAIFLDQDKLSVAYGDITTGDLYLCHYKENLQSNFSDLMNRVMPSQVIGNLKAREFYNSLPILKLGVYPRFEEYFDYAFETEHAKNNVCRQFGDNAVQVYELKTNKQDLSVLGGFLEYLQDTQKRSLKNINKIVRVKDNLYMTIDSNTRRNLELVETIRERKKYGSLLWLMDKTKTSMGARRFRTMFDEPLQNSTEINERLDAVEDLAKNLILRDRLADSLANIRDIERYCGKIAYGSILPPELVNLKKSLQEIPNVKKILANCKSRKLCFCRDNLNEYDEIITLLDNAIDPNASTSMKEGGYIREKFNEELDDLRNAKDTAKRECDKLEEIEREQTGIKNLKITYNNVFGFYIEVSKGQTDLVPLRYTRKQTLTNAERYTTPDLKELEDRIFSSKENAEKLEQKLYKMLLEYLSNYLVEFANTGKLLAEIDAMLSLAVAAVKYNFCKPVIGKGVDRIEIVEGRHPIVENFVKDGSFIANDTILDDKDNKMMIITGPNMAGKSTYMRQVAIITFLAHIGSFVPAKSAQIAITDRIFTRVGASDDLAFGQSTFMVEMSEVANILANATEKSLVVLDEIGRGTSTFDGLSIAWAVVEYMSKNLHCKTLFATHYHELSELEGMIEGVKNYKVTVKEISDSVIFLHKIIRGHANKSFGVEVAKLAGVPDKVIERAKEISVNLESVNEKLDMNIFGEDEEKRKLEKNNKKGQEVLAVLKDIDINRLSPLESFEVLQDLISKAKD
ncbi:MAG: DNA mismatch repair protein MutS [Clostridia bacterium]|nr:DNA mismatch repair protein MutS [Clostridia bacterium]